MKSDMLDSIEKDICLRDIKDRIMSDFYIIITLMQRKNLIIQKSDMLDSIEKDICLRNIKDRIMSDFYISIARLP